MRMWRGLNWFERTDMRKKILKLATVSIAVITIICIAVFYILNWLHPEKNGNAEESDYRHEIYECRRNAAF